MITIINNKPYKNRYCTKEEPWDGKREDDELINHVDSEETPESIEMDGNTITMSCPHCGHVWSVTCD